MKNKPASELALWRFDHQPDAIPRGRRLRVELLAPAVVHFSIDGWRTIRDIETRDTGLGFHFADLSTEKMKQGEELAFTFRWPGGGNRWEGRDFKIVVESPPAADKSPEARLFKDSRHAVEAGSGR